MNKAILIGNLTKEPELKTTQSGLSVCRFTIAVNRKFKDAQGNQVTDFIPVITWRGIAESCAKYLAKGRKVAVAGEIQTRSYDSQDGTKRYVTEIVASDVEFLSPKPDSQGGSFGGNGGGMSMPSEPNMNLFTAMDEESLPF